MTAREDLSRLLASSSAVTYGLPFLTVGSALVATLLLEHYVFRTPLFFKSIMLSTWVGGVRPGLLAVLLSAASISLVLSPQGLVETRFPNVPNLVAFLLTAALVSSWSATRRRAEHALRRARDELELRVQERTAELNTSREQLQSLARRLLSAQEEERSRLAVELHDELGQILTAVKISLGSLARESGAAPAPAHLREAMASVDRAMERVQDLAMDLRPSQLDDLGLGAAIRSHADEFAHVTHIETHLSIDAVPRLPADLEIACFRLAQEALTDTARHTQARNVWVDLRLDAEALELRVRDDGVGFDAGLARERAIRGASMGLLGMQERSALAGGEFHLSTRAGGGEGARR
jgi:signal transduction histidine kinase